MGKDSLRPGKVVSYLPKSPCFESGDRHLPIKGSGSSSAKVLERSTVDPLCKRCRRSPQELSWNGDLGGGSQGQSLKREENCLFRKVVVRMGSGKQDGWTAALTAKDGERVQPAACPPRLWLTSWKDASG